MATIINTNEPNDFGAGGYRIELLDLVLGPGESAEVSDEEAQGFLLHPHITVTGLTTPEPTGTEALSQPTGGLVMPAASPDAPTPVQPETAEVTA